MTRKSDRLGIVRDKDDFDRGYWRRYDGLTRPHGPARALEGWKTCDDELRFEASARRGS